MDWYQIAALMFGNLAWVLPLFLWSRSESNSDRREIHGILNELKEEQKSFHARLCVLEERYLQMMMERK